MRLKLLPVIAVLILLIAVNVSSYSFDKITIQGKLVDKDGNPLTGEHNIKAEILKSSSDNTVLHTQSFTNVEVKGGVFSVSLDVPTDSKIFSENHDTQLQLYVGTEKFTSLVPITSSGYSFYARNAIDSSSSAQEKTGPLTINNNFFVAGETKLDDLTSTGTITIDATGSAPTFPVFVLKTNSGTTLNILTADGTLNVNNANINNNLQIGNSICNSAGTCVPINTLLGSLLWSKSGTTNNIFYDKGFVGIGTSTPVYDLDVNGYMSASNVIVKEDLSALNGVFDNTETKMLNVIGAGMGEEDGIIKITAFDGTEKDIIWANGVFAGPGFYVKDGRVNTELFVGMNDEISLSASGIETFKTIRTPTLASYDSTGLKFTDYLNVVHMIIANNGNVGIGTLTPAQKLDVVGNIKSSGTICDGTGKCIGSGSGPWLQSGTTVYYNSGKVGVGTASPIMRLDVVGPNVVPYSSGISSDAAFRIDSSSTTGYYPVLDSGIYSGYISGVLQNFAWLQARDRNNYAISDNLILNPYGGSSTGRVLIGALSSSSNEKLYVNGNIKSTGLICDGNNKCVGYTPWIVSGTNLYYATGNVGVGTTLPSYPLDIVSNPGGLTFDAMPTNAQIGFSSRKSSSPNTQHAIGVYGQAKANNAAANSYGGYFVGAGTLRQQSVGVYAQGGDAAGIFIGRVGIGTQFPQTALDVVGDIRASGKICLTSGKCLGDTVAATSQFWSSVVGYPSNIYYSAGKVAIGASTNPTYNLDVTGTARVTGALVATSTSNQVYAVYAP